MSVFPVPERSEGHQGRGDGQQQRNIQMSRPPATATRHDAVTAATKKTAAIIA